MTNEMSRAEIMKKLALDDRKNFATLYLQPAIEKGYLELSIPDKLTSSKQKYRLTLFGKKMIEVKK